MYFDPHNVNPETLVIEREDQLAACEIIKRLREEDPLFFLYLVFWAYGLPAKVAAVKVYGDTPPCKSAFSNKRQRLTQEFRATRENTRTPLCHPNRPSPSA